MAMLRISKDIERLARSMHQQKLEPDYIRHYLLEAYQLDMPSVDQLFEKLGIGRKGPRGGGDGHGGGMAARPGGEQGGVKKQSFY